MKNLINKMRKYEVIQSIPLSRLHLYSQTVKIVEENSKPTFEEYCLYSQHSSYNFTHLATQDEIQKITDKYNSQISPYYAASRLWLDAIIDPVDTRKWIAMGIEAANHSPITKQYNVGIIQT